jgi:hypothetical protein
MSASIRSKAAPTNYMPRPVRLMAAHAPAETIEGPNLSEIEKSLLDCGICEPWGRSSCRKCQKCAALARIVQVAIKLHTIAPPKRSQLASSAVHVRGYFMPPGRNWSADSGEY